MLDIVLEVVRALILLGIVLYLMRAKKTALKHTARAGN